MDTTAVNGARVLVVDDNTQNVTVLKRLLKRVGISEAEGLTDSSQVMQRIETFQPDLVLLDLHMPDPDGFELLDLIGALGDDTWYLPVIVLTADVTEEAKQRALALGAADFLTKPFGLTETALRVKNNIHTRQLHEQVRHQAAMLGMQVADLTADREETTARIRRVTLLANELETALTMVYQPIVDIESNTPIGAEALARFDTDPVRGPDLWFADAEEAGMALQFELTAIRSAIAHADGLPEEAFLSLNLSAKSLCSPAFMDMVRAGAARPLVVELTEYERIDDYAVVGEALDGMQSQGVRLAVDDAGSGFASLHHILQLDPAFIKLDRQLIAGIDTDPARRSLASALVRFSSETGASLIAEGIENQAELDVVRDLGITLGQGYLLGRPGPLPLPRND